MGGMFGVVDGDFVKKDYIEWAPSTEEETQHVLEWVSVLGDVMSTLGASIQFFKPIPEGRQITLPFLFPSIGLEGRFVIQLDKYGEDPESDDDGSKERVPEPRRAPHRPPEVHW
jgi:hypothetical protein